MSIFEEIWSLQCLIKCQVEISAENILKIPLFSGKYDTCAEFA